METTTWKRVDPALRAELEALLKRPTSPTVYYSTYADAMGWWLLLMLACVGGGAAAAWEVLSSPLGLGETLSFLVRHPADIPRFLLLSPAYGGLLAALVVGAWTATTGSATISGAASRSRRRRSSWCAAARSRSSSTPT